MRPGEPDRLRDGRVISTVLRGRERRAGRYLVVHHVVRDTGGAPEGAPTRIAVVASKKVGNAVTRNRAKRVLREAARCVAWSPGLDVVLVARASAAVARTQQVVEDLQATASAAGVVRTPQDVA